VAAPDWNNRITRHGTADPSDLAGNPANARVHGMDQQEMMIAALNATGWVRDVIVNERTGLILDGHMRVAIARRRKEDSIPVSYVDLSPEEERLALATFDPLAAMALTDAGKHRAIYDQGGAPDWAAALIAKAHEAEAQPDELPQGATAFRADAMESYLTGDQRQIQLPLLASEYDQTIQRLAAIREAFGFERNTEALLWLLDRDLDAHQGDQA
jgi:ParB-like chromosome segregation protein Spo0J